MRLILMATVLGVVALLQVGAWATTCDPNYVTQAGKVFTVLPTGLDDTANIQCALNAATALGAGSTVQLACGTYFTGMIEVTGFNGTFKGEGKDATIIHSLPNLPCGDVLAADLPALFKFRLSQAKVSDLTIDITDPAPCMEYWYGQEMFAELFVTGTSSAVTGCDDLPGPSLSGVTVERVGFKGVGNWEDGYNARYGLLFAPECWSETAKIQGDAIITGSSFEELEIAVGGFQLQSCTVRIGGGPPLKNTTTDVREGILFEDFNDTAMEISYNDIQAYWANLEAYHADFWPANPQMSTYLVTHNTIRVDVYSDGMWMQDTLADESCGKMFQADIADNDFVINTECCAAINGWGGMKDVLVRNNRFTGHGGWGIRMGWVWPDSPDAGWLIKGNNFQNFDALAFPVGLLWASANCAVVGGKAKFNVLNLGTGNILTGVNNMHGDPPGPIISAEEQLKLDKMRHTR